MGEGTLFYLLGLLEDRVLSMGKEGTMWGPVILVPKPLLDPCPLEVTLGSRPHPHLHGGPLLSLAGVPSHLDLITPTLGSP